MSSIKFEHIRKVYDNNVEVVKDFSLDIDCIDPVYAPGTGVPEPHGLTVDEVEYLTAKILSTGKVVSMDLVEFNPLLDSSDKTWNACVQLLRCVDSYIKQ